MAKYQFDPKKDPPSSGSRQDYITPGRHPVRITKYSDNPSNAGNPMHAFTFEVRRGDQKGKKISDWFVMPKKRSDSRVPLARLNQLIVAAAQLKGNTARSIELSKLVGKDLLVDIGDVRQEAQKGADGREYPARTISRIAEYIDPNAKSDDDEDDEDEEDPDEDEEDEEDEEEDEDDEDDEEDEEEDEDEEPAPPARRGRAATAVATRAKAKTATKPAAKTAKKATAKATTKRKAAVDDDDEDELFDDDDDD